jgi:hypothetical protein
LSIPRGESRTSLGKFSSAPKSMVQAEIP